MSCRQGLLIAFTTLALVIVDQPAQAYRLKPAGTDDERAVVRLTAKWWEFSLVRISDIIVEHFSDGVHEELTHRIWGCKPPEGAAIEDTTCISFSATPTPVIYGVRWNDNPPFKLDATSEKSCKVSEPIRLPDRQPDCWLLLFYDAEKKALPPNAAFRQGSEKDALLYRVHFGDLQFLHSMASWNGETMEQTKARIMMWAEFTYTIAQGRISPTTKLSATGIAGFDQVLGKYWSDVKGLFTFGVEKYADQIPEVALGSLMHMIQDSFSTSHVRREPPAGTCDVKDGAAKAGRVLEFYAYNQQKRKSHGERDARKWMLRGLHDEKGGDAVSVGQSVKAFLDANAPWRDVQKYLDRCVYEVTKDDLNKPAGPGPFVK